MNKYIIFVHGLTGKVGTTWGLFPQLLSEDPTLGDYRVKEFGYYSPNFAWIKPAPSISSIANGVLSDIRAECDLENDDIILVGHSMGGIVIKKLLLRLNAQGIKHNISKVCFFDVPHDGSGLAKIAKYISWRNKHLKSLVSNSTDLDDIHEQWVDKRIDQHLDILSIIDANETIVSAMSSKSIFRHHQIETINNVDHSSIVKPKTANDNIVIHLKKFIKSKRSLGKFNSQIGKPIYEWLKYDERKHELPYKTDSARQLAFDSLTQALESETPYVRLTGLSGLGKSRLILEYKNHKNIDDEDFLVLNGADLETAIKNEISRLSESGVTGYVIIDNCLVELHNYAVNAIITNKSNLKLITTYFYHDEPRHLKNSIPIKLEKLASEQINEIIHERLPQLDAPLRKQLEAFIEGFPLLAQMATHELQNDGALTTNFNEPELVEKLINGDGALTDESRDLLIVFSLFDYFKFQKDSHQASNIDADFINRIAQTDQKCFDKTITIFSQKELINCTSNFARIVPKPLALNLAMQWWNTSLFDRQSDLVSQLPPSLLESFCKQIKYLDSSMNIQEFVKNFCASNRPFGQAELLLTKAGSRLFRALVEVNPVVTTQLIFRIINNLDDTDILSISGDIRRNFIWSLEMLVFHDSCFNEAAWCLFKFAQFENESYGNNATGQFAQLFRINLCGTEASFEKRLALLDKAMGLNTESADSVIIQAIKSAISTQGGTRVVGAEYQGTKPELKEWQPEKYSEIYDYWQHHLNTLITLIKRGNITEQVKNVFGHEIRGLIKYPIQQQLDLFFKEVIRFSGKYWPTAAQSITHALQFDVKGLEPKEIELLKSWEQLLSPDDNDLEEKLKLIVLNPSREYVKDADGRYIDVAAEDAKALAESIKGTYNDLIPHLKMLLTFPEHKQSWIFAKHLAIQLDENAINVILNNLLNSLRRDKPTNIQFLAGFLSGINDKNINKWMEIIELIASDEALVQYYPDTVRTGKFNSHHLDIFLGLISTGRLPSSAASILSYGSVTQHLTEKEITEFCLSLSKFDATAVWVALDNLSMYVFGRTDLDLKLINPTLAILVLNVSFKKNDKLYQFDSHHWLDSVEKLLDTEDKEFALKLCLHLIDQVGSYDINYNDLWDYIGEAFYKAFELHGEYLWFKVSSKFLDENYKKSYRLLDLLGSGKSYHTRDKSIFDLLDANSIVEWCKDEVALMITTHAIKMFILDGDNRIFNPLLLRLISEYSDNESFNSTVSANFSSRSWMGSLIPYLREDKKLIEALIDHENIKIRNWAKQFVDYIDRKIDYETKQEAEEKMLRGFD
ncbi:MULTISPECIES: esterase/lipase family protein [Acinetobacter]|uniref:esterase/lipase family protein n=1 Tax=Acinetobacter TaxID=469 RepID=UPI0020032BF7|nr:alpha/beta hydrolase [Acinetobacter radioresistens]MCK4080415.1 alpha/beta hydrolase [Acinetobacter radioresistens]MCU4501070.1 alpha/beta hydrolase [Acinetobacter radioresistens]